jgi:succinate-semialdehyde dehydrogenase/glutarate-semialdehyde dehydrogenase
MTINTINPATGKLIQSYNEMSDTHVSQIIDECQKAFQTWRTVDFSTRAHGIKKIASLLRERKNDYAKLMTEEMGKPIKQAIAEIEKCALTCDHYADHAENYLKSRIIPTEMKKSYVTYQPLGIIFAIMPWNFPFWQIFRFAAPTLMAGNTALLKHAPISTGTAIAIENLFLESGITKNIFRTLIISEDQASNVIHHPAVSAVTLTGSPRAGKAVSAISGSQLKKTVLELGGSDPYLILEDADLELAANACVTSRMLNAGQSCIAAKRLIVIESIQNQFLDLVKKNLDKYKVGNPLDPETDCGPLARKDLRDKVHEQVSRCIELGAEVIMGGKIPADEGFYYIPTLLKNIKKGMPAYDEEIFGPVISIISAKNEEEAIAIANDTGYGLGAGIFSKDIARAEKIAVEKIQSGSCVINTFLSSNPSLPFGGIKNSGYGRELSAEGILSFVNVKTISIKDS